MAQPGAGAGRARERAGTQAGRLEAAQVRAMFDRIAGVYDLMNTAMTAGLHHRWRARAADLARVGPGGRVLDVATGTGDLALELAGRVAPGGEVLGSDFSEGMLERARAKAAATADGVRPRFEWARRAGAALRRRLLRRRDGRLRRAQLLRPRARASARWRGSCAPAAASSCSRSRRPTGRRCRSSTRCGSIASCPRSGRLARRGASALALARASAPTGAAIADAYTYLPNSVKRFPAPAELAGELRARRARARSPTC